MGHLSLFRLGAASASVDVATCDVSTFAPRHTKVAACIADATSQSLLTVKTAAWQTIAQGATG